MDPGPSFATLLYRYWFFGWLFRDACRGNALERIAALRYNAERARWLPTYMRRWAVLALAAYGSGSACEALGLDRMASLAFVPACLTVPVLAVACAAWWLLRSDGSRYMDGTLR